MDNDLLVNALLRALFWVERSEYFAEVGSAYYRRYDFQCIWRFLPHSARAALMEGLEKGLIRFDRSVDPCGLVDPFDPDSVRINMGADYPPLLFGYLPGLSKKGFETVTTALGISQELTGRREQLYLSDDVSSDAPDWLLDSWNKIKSSPDGSVNDIEDQLMHPLDFSKVMISDVIEVEGNDAIERNLTIDGELFFAEDISISDLVHQTATAFGLQRIFISDYEGDTAGIECYSERPFDGRTSYGKGDVFKDSWGDYFLSEVVLDQEAPFAYCVRNECLEQYKCLKVMGGTGTQIDPGKWIGEKKEYVWPSSIYPDPLLAITSRPDLVAPLIRKDLRNAAVLAENEWADAIEKGEFGRLREIVKEHHEFGQRTFDELVLSDADIDATIDGFGSTPGRFWRI